MNGHVTVRQALHEPFSRARFSLAPHFAAKPFDRPSILPPHAEELGAPT
jgi:hypothetical protein